MASPEQNRAAWMLLAAELEKLLVDRREEARSMVGLIDLEDYTVAAIRAQMEAAQESHRATVWAAQRLLEALQALPAPEVPRDDETGQGDILEELSSTSVEKPVEHRTELPDLETHAFVRTEPCGATQPHLCGFYAWPSGAAPNVRIGWYWCPGVQA